jgi:Lrp/AsnC family transcriptional regulator, regulator for asnA, asnC and gidA
MLDLIYLISKRYRLKGKEMESRKKKKLPIFDDLDRIIMRELQKDARSSFLRIGKKVGASEGTVRNRVRLAQKDEIVQLKAIINPEKLGFEFNCVMGFEILRNKLEEIGSSLAEIPNVYFLSSCTGTFDLIAILFFRNTLEFDEFMREKIGKLPGIIRTQTFVNMQVIKKPWSVDADVIKLLET